MLFHLDHVIVGVRDLDPAVADWREIGLIASDGGSHPKHGTRNAIVRFPDGTFLELMAIADAPKLRAYAPPLLELLEEHPDTVIGYALRADDIESAHAAVAASGMRVTPMWPGEGRRASGRVATWRSFRIADPAFPFVVSYDGPPTSEPAASPLAPRGVGTVLLEHPEPDAVAERLARAFGGSRTERVVRLASGAIRVDPAKGTGPLVAGIELRVDRADDALAALRRSRARIDGSSVADERLHGLRLTVDSMSRPGRLVD